MNKRGSSGQIIILTGVLLAASVIIIAAISSQMANLRTITPEQRMTSILDDFRDLRQSFGKALNYNLVEPYNNTVPSSYGWPDAWYCYYVGNIENLSSAFNETFDEFYALELSKGNILEARLLDYQINEYGTAYTVVISLSLGNGKESMSENVSYNIVCNSYLTYI
ncbi:MAG: hypothetical protein J7K13_06185 [Thermoplasmata archaeon]|nr:hypothetical protein [Thermoplasmata archaeon]